MRNQLNSNPQLAPMDSTNNPSGEVDRPDRLASKRTRRAKRRGARKSSSRHLRFESLEARRVLASFLKFDSIQGSSTDAVHNKEVEVRDFFWSVSSNAASDSSGGSTLVSDLVINKGFDKATPALMKAPVADIKDDKVTLSVRQDGAQSPFDYLQIEFANPTVTDYRVADGPSGIEEANETISIGFNELDATYIATDKNGSAGDKTDFEWDILAGKERQNAEFSKSEEDDGSIDLEDQPHLLIDGHKLPFEAFSWTATSFANFQLPLKEFGQQGSAGALNVSRNVDNNTLAFLDAIATNDSLGEVKLIDTMTVSNDQTFLYEWTLYDTKVSNFAIYGDGVTRASNELAFTFSKVDIKFTPFSVDEKGDVKEGKKTEVSWNIEKVGDIGVGFGGDKPELERGSPDSLPVPNLLTFPDGGKLAVESVQWGAIRPDVKGPRTEYQDLSLTGFVDNVSPGLVGALASGTVIAPGTSKALLLEMGVRISDSLPVRSEWSLNDVVVTSYSVSSSPGGRPTFSLSLAVGSAKVKQTNFDFEKGTKKGESSLSWNQVTNTVEGGSGFGGNDFSIEQQPPLQLKFYDRDSSDTEIAIESVDWSIFNSGVDERTSRPNASDFSIVAAAGNHSLGINAALVTGDTIDKIEIVRADVVSKDNPDTKEIEPTKLRTSYQWTLTDVVVTSFSTSSNSDLEFGDDLFTFAPSEVQLTTYSVDKTGATGDAKGAITWDLTKGSDGISKKSGPIAETEINLAPSNRLNFGSDGEEVGRFKTLDLLGFNWTASSNNSAQFPSSARAIADDYSYVFYGLPQPELIGRVVTQKPVESIDLETRIVAGGATPPAPFATTELEDHRFTSFAFSDAGDTTVSTLSGSPDKLKFEFANIDEKSGTKKSVNTFGWDLEKNAINDKAGFVNSEADANKGAKHILQFGTNSSSAILSIDAISWGVSRETPPARSGSGSPKDLDPGTVVGSDISLTAPLDGQSPGLLDALVEGNTIPKLVLSSYFETFTDLKNITKTDAYRTWTLNEVYVTSYTVDTDDMGRGYVNFTLSPSVIDAAYRARSKDGSELIGNTQIGFASQPTTSGISDVVAFDSTGDTKVSLLKAFQNPNSSARSLSFELIDNSKPALFDSVTIEGGTLTIAYKPGNTGSATLKVRATNSLGLSVTTSFKVSVSAAYDFGDAPDPTYSTLLANDGPRHRLGSLLFLGGTVDQESDGSPNANATGDDARGQDDDDGVVFNPVLIAGESTVFTVTASTVGRLDGWIDLNGNGTFDDPAEKIFDDVALTAGANRLTYLVPAGTPKNDGTFARFRASLGGGLKPTGLASSGEVEDYAVSIDEGLVVTLPSSSTAQDFEVKLDGADVVVTNKGTGVEVDRQPLGEVGTVVITAPDGDDDTLTIDFGDGEITVPIEFDGGAGGNDGIELTGGILDSFDASLIGPGQGAIDVNGDGIPDIYFENLEPVDLTGSVIPEANFGLDVAGIQDPILEDFGTTDDGNMQLRFSEQSSEDFWFSNPEDSLTITTSGENSLVQIGTPDAAFAPTLINLLGEPGDTFRLTGPNVVPDNSFLTLVDATLDLNNHDETLGALAGNGIVDAGQAILTFGVNGQSGGFHGDILGTGAAIKLGDGAIVTSSSISYAGDVLVEEGTWNVLGSFTDLAIFGVGSLGKLEGDGVIQSHLFVVPGGQVAPGGTGIGTLATEGVEFHEGATYVAEIDGGEHDQLSVSGQVILNDAFLELEIGLVPAVGSEVVLINNTSADPVVGQFAQGTQPQQYGDHVIEIDYEGGDGNDVIARILDPNTHVIDPNSLMLISLEATDLNGNPLPDGGIQPGTEFRLNAYTQDLRDQPLGVFGAFADVTYDSGRVSNVGDFETGEGFGLFTVDSKAGEFDEIGVVGGATIDTPEDGRLQHVWSVNLVAGSPGVLEFGVNPPESLNSENLLHGIDSIISDDLVEYVGTTVTINDVVVGGPKMSVSLVATDLNGNPLPGGEVPSGEPFRLNAYTQDLRPGAEGVFAAFVDVPYNSADRFSIDGNPMTPEAFKEAFLAGAGFNLLSALEGNNEFDEVGAVYDTVVEIPDPASPHLLWSVDLIAGSPGTLEFGANAPEDAFSENLLLGIDSVIPNDEIEYVGTSLTVTPADVQESLMSISLTATDLGGNPLPGGKIRSGQSFLLNAYAQDLRPDGLGVFAAALDVPYSEANRFSVAGNPATPEAFESSFLPGPGFVALSALDGTNEFDEVMFVRDVFFDEAEPTAPQLVWTIELVAGTQGALEFGSNGPEAFNSENLLRGIDEVIGNDQVQFVGTSLEVIAPIVSNTDVNISLVATDLNGNPLPEDSIASGESFLLTAYVDNQIFGSDDGVFAAYMDVAFNNADRFSIPGNPTTPDDVAAAFNFAPEFGNGRRAELESTEFSEVGAFYDIIGQTFPDASRQQLWSIELVAGAPGNLEFATNPADDLPNGEVLVFGFNEAIPQENVGYGGTSLTVTQPTVDDALMSISLRATDLNGNPLPNGVIESGQSFRLNAFVQDQRSVFDAGGVFAAFLDVPYNSSDRFLIPGNPTTAEAFEAAFMPGPNFTLFTATDGASEFDEIGAIYDFVGIGLPILDPIGEQLLWSIDLVAGSAGTLEFGANAPEAQTSENLLVGIDEVISSDDIQFVGTSLTITEAVSQDAPLSVFLKATDLNGTPLPDNGIESGTEFVLNAYVQDTRGFAAAGVFAAFLDVPYNSDQFTVAGNPSTPEEFRAAFMAGPEFILLSAIDGAGEFDEVGAIYDSVNNLFPIPDPSAERLLWSVNLVSGSAGVIEFGANAPEAQGSENLLADSVEVLDPGDVQFVGTSVTVTDPVATGPLMSISLVATDLNGNPLPEDKIESGETFRLSAFVQDERPVFAAEGVFGAFLDVPYSGDRFSIVGNPSTPEEFKAAFTVGSEFSFFAATDSTNEFDEIGAIYDSTNQPIPIPNPTQERLLWSIDLVAGSPGALEFGANGPESQFSENLLVGLNDLIPNDAIDFIGTSLMIIAPTGGGELLELQIDATRDGVSLLNADRVLNAEVGEKFDLEVSYSDLREAFDRTGAFTVYSDIVASNNNVFMPVVSETQIITVSSSLQDSSDGFATLSMDGSSTTAQIPFLDLALRTEESITSALEDKLGFGEGNILVYSLPRESTDDFTFVVRFVGDAQEFQNVPRLTFDASTITGATVTSSTSEVPVFINNNEAEGLNPDAVRFNIDFRSSDINGNPVVYGQVPSGTFEPNGSAIFNEVGGSGPISPGGIRAFAADNGGPDFTGTEFEAFSIEVLVTAAASDVAVSLDLADDPGNELSLYGLDNAVAPQDVIFDTTPVTGKAAFKASFTEPVVNLPPSTPVGLSTTSNSLTSMTFSWEASTDDHTPQENIRYILKIGTIEGGDDFLSDGNGAFIEGETSFTIDNNAPGRPLFWSVKAVDEAGLESDFSEIDFGFAGDQDSGDAPESYWTTYAGGGPRHLIGNLFLGDGVTADADGQPSDNSDADQDDGVDLATTIFSGADADASTTLYVESSGDGFLDAWFDFNGNGKFDHPAEHLGRGDSIELTAGINLIDLTVPAGTANGTVNARFRVSSSGNLEPFDIGTVAADGEVEDYQFVIESQAEVKSVEVTPLSGETVFTVTDGVVIISQDGVELFRSNSVEDVNINGSEADDKFVLGDVSADGQPKYNAVGGAGKDTVEFSVPNQVLADALKALREIEVIDVRNSGGDSIEIDSATVEMISDEANTVTLAVDKEDEVKLDEGWRVTTTESENGEFFRVAENDGKKLRFTGGGDWSNPVLQADANNNGEVTSIDALVILNQIVRGEFTVNGSTAFVNAAEVENHPQRFYDTNSDDVLTPIDALRVLNYLVRNPPGGEGEAVPNDFVKRANAEESVEQETSPPVQVVASSSKQLQSAYANGSTMDDTIDLLVAEWTVETEEEQSDSLDQAFAEFMIR